MSKTKIPSWANSPHVGKTVTWSSHGSGKTREKTGVIVAYVPPNNNIRYIINVSKSASNLQGQTFSDIPRYLVAVTGPAGQIKYYTPRASVIDRILDNQEPTALDMIAAERRRQIEEEGWTPKDDDELNSRGELAAAAACFAVGEIGLQYDYLDAPDNAVWPWPGTTHVPGKKNQMNDLVKAGALIVAEIERLMRADKKSKGVTT